MAELNRVGPTLARAKNMPRPDQTEFLESILESSVDSSIVALDLEGTILTWNEGARRIYGYEAAEMVGMQSSVLLYGSHEANTAKAAEIRAETRAHGRWAGEVHRARKSGELFVAHVTMTLRRSRNGAAIGFTLISRDLTEPERMARALDKSKAEKDDLTLSLADRTADFDKQSALLHENQDMFRRLAETGRQVFFLSSTDYATMHYVSPSYAEVWGRSCESLYKDPRSWLDGIHPLDRDRVETELAKDAGDRLDFQYRILRPDKTTRWIMARLEKVDVSVGRVRRLCGVAMDVTDIKNAQFDLAKSETKYRRLFESAKDGILILDVTEGSILEINPFLIELLGHSKEACLGKKLWDIGFFNNIDVSKKLFAELQASGYVRYDDIPLKTKDGRAVQVEFVSNVYSVGEGTVIQCNVRDITERKHAEDNLCRLASIVESLDDCVMSVSMDGAIETWNPACERVFGYTAKEIVGKPVATLCPAALVEDQARMIARVRDGTSQRQHETIRLAKTGKPIEVSMSLSALKSSQGAPKGHSTVIRDITANKQLEAKLRQSQKMEGIGRLAGGIAHDFNNLLTAILGYSELLLLSLAPNDAHRADVEQISKAGARAETLTRQLLAFSRQQVVATKVLDVNAAILELDKMLRRIIGEHIVLTFLPGRDLGRVRLALGQIEQIVMNLCVNAKDAMPDGGRLLIEASNVEPRAGFVPSVSQPKEGPRVLISVSDTGCGMNPEILSHLYEPYFTTKEKGKGTGLGLSTVYGIVEQNGGSIDVYSEPGHGTTFKLYFPRVGEPLVPVDVAPPAAAERGGSETLLLVEDDAMVREFTVRVLREAGYLLLVADSPAEAVRIVGEHAGEIRVMLTDVVMPGMLGYELVHRVAPLKPDMKIIYMSGYTEQSIIERALLKGAQFIQKPMGREVLLQEIRKALDAPRAPA